MSLWQNYLSLNLGHPKKNRNETIRYCHAYRQSSFRQNCPLPRIGSEQKIRCEEPRYDAGGGGINVSKAIARLEGESFCVFTSGGPIGSMLEELVQKEAITFEAVKTANWTRESFVAVDDNTNSQYRFGFSGSAISDEEQKEIMATIQEIKPKYLVLSGSLNEGLPTDYYKNIADLAKQSGSKVIVDTSGEALQKVLETGVYLIKPNVGNWPN